MGGGEQVGSDSDQLRYSFQGGGGLDDDPPVLIIGQALAEVAEQERGALDADQVSEPQAAGGDFGAELTGPLAIAGEPAGGERGQPPGVFWSP